MPKLKKWRPRASVVLLALLGIAVCTRLSVWQWQRGQDKQAILDQRQQSSAVPATPTPQLDADAMPFGAHLELLGRWRPEQTVLLDNQTRRGQPGVHVLTVYELDAGGSLLVNRGWSAAPLDRSQSPVIEPPGDGAALGLLRPLPQAGIAAPPQCPKAPLARVNYPTIEDLRCMLGEDILPGLLLLNPALPGVYAREWQHFELPPERHYGYAFQWAALAATILILLLVLNRR